MSSREPIVIFGEAPPFPWERKGKVCSGPLTDQRMPGIKKQSEILGAAAMAMAGGGAAIIGAGQGRMVRGPAGHGMAGGTEVEPPA